ncbi:MAG: VWA domain-containing protein [Akkermansiaceae bacterium]|nr:VWA domain-containing protein [Akkermansiaceae bacterium]
MNDHSDKQEAIADQLMDSLLREQARSESDREEAIRQIEIAMMEETLRHSREGDGINLRRLLVSGAVAAVLVLGFGFALSLFIDPGSEHAGENSFLFAYEHGNDQAPDSTSSDRRAGVAFSARRPSSPDASSSKVITAQGLGGPGVPVPDVAYSMPSIDVGTDDEFGAAWGGNGFGGAMAYRTPRGHLPGPHDRQANSYRNERYGPLVDQVWRHPLKSPLSTFSIDVDNASYANLRRMIRSGQRIPADAVRIEECINAFDYDYEGPEDGRAFAVHKELMTCPWNERNMLVKVGIKGREVEAAKRPASNLVFLIDVSGSMQNSDKLPLVKESLKLLLHQLDERDRVAYVVYAGREGVVLPPTRMTESGRVRALEALDNLHAGGSTNGEAGIKQAYQLAAENFVEEGVNRVILASDGDFNVGLTGDDELVALVKERAAANIYLSALAFGTGNLNDAMFEAISNEGNGNYFYIDGIREGRKVFLTKLTGTLVTIAKDVKIQVEFNPKKVGAYRLIGYANRVLETEDFDNDQVDAGDIGAGHSVTAFYEIIPAELLKMANPGLKGLKYQKPIESVVEGPSDEWLTLKLRHKHPQGDVSALQETVIKGEPTAWQRADADARFAASVALFGMKLRGMDEVSEVSWNKVIQLAKPGLANDPNEDRAEFLGLVERLRERSR